MRKGKYYKYALKILEYLSKNEFELQYSLTHRASNLAKTLKMPKSSLFNVLSWLEENNLIKIQVSHHVFYTGLQVRYFTRISITTKGLDFYLKEIQQKDYGF